MAQTCNGSLGDPVVNYNFGRGTPDRGVPIPEETNYNYSNADVPADGSYTLVKTTAGMSHVRNGNWLLVTNHTPNDPDGYMMLINADDKQAGIFYQESIKNLCPGTTYEFGAWIINLMAKPGIRPNLKFLIETPSGEVLKEFDTEEIPEGTKDDWIQYARIFTTGSNVNEVVVKIKNNGLGGGGNDFCLDDITFRPCGPEIKPSVNGTAGQIENICVGETKTITLSADVTAGVYNVPQYLWQIQNAAGMWEDLPAETLNKIDIPFHNATLGSYKYRLLAAETGNINSENCRANSPEFTINVNALPAPVANEPLSVCVGKPIFLTVSGEASQYSWTGPNGFHSTDRSPVIPGADFSMAGTYHVTVTNAANCTGIAETKVTVADPPDAEIDPITPICKGSGINLQAHGGTAYRWLPETGLSASNIANPIASPSETTRYTVFVSNGICETSAQVDVVVFKELTADAGPDKKMIKGNSVTLNGNISGDNASGFWSPADDLDDPSGLNPVATPAHSMIYTLNVISANGCSSAIDEVFVKVYEKLVIPNTFSPNGDGINDSWNITAIDVYPEAKVKVVNRYGQLMFQSSGYQKPWDGKYKGTDVPAGVYYYIVSLSPGLKAETGSITLIR